MLNEVDGWFRKNSTTQWKHAVAWFNRGSNECLAHVYDAAHNSDPAYDFIGQTQAGSIFLPENIMDFGKMNGTAMLLGANATTSCALNLTIKPAMQTTYMAVARAVDMNGNSSDTWNESARRFLTLETNGLLDELLSDPGFEAAGWTLRSPNASISTSEHYDGGAKSLKLANEARTSDIFDDGLAELNVSYPTSGDSHFLVTGYIKRSSATPGTDFGRGVSFVVTANYSNSSTGCYFYSLFEVPRNGAAFTIDRTGQWMRVGGYIDLPATDNGFCDGGELTSILKFKVMKYGSGEFYIDALSLKEVGTG
jgi:hypothetical protein